MLLAGQPAGAARWPVLIARSVESSFSLRSHTHGQPGTRREEIELRTPPPVAEKIVLQLADLLVMMIQCTSVTISAFSLYNSKAFICL